MPILHCYVHVRSHQINHLILIRVPTPVLHKKPNSLINVGGSKNTNHHCQTRNNSYKYCKDNPRRSIHDKGSKIDLVKQDLEGRTYKVLILQHHHKYSEGNLVVEWRVKDPSSINRPTTSREHKPIRQILNTPQRTRSKSCYRHLPLTYIRN
jgi:hypothetical protein